MAVIQPRPTHILYQCAKFGYDRRSVVINSLKIDPHMSKVKVTGTVHCFLKVRSYHKNLAI